MIRHGAHEKQDLCTEKQGRGLNVVICCYNTG